MARGPSGRGCDACRAQHKKCDLAQPACSRCRGLRIKCTGCGEKRFKFQLDKRASTPQESSSSAQQRMSRNATLQIHTPGNETTRLQKAFVAKLRSSEDLRYSIVFRWGSFLTEVPKRLGSNKALDAAVRALLTRHAELSLRQDPCDPRAPAALDYNRGLSALRVVLEDRRAAVSAETLCAVMLLIYCQARSDDQFTFFWSPHGKGLAQLLRIRQFPSGKDHFESYLFGGLSATLVLQSFANREIALCSQEYDQLEDALAGAAKSLGARDNRSWRYMARISRLMVESRDAIAFGFPLHTMVIEAEQLKQSMDTLIGDMGSQLGTADTESPSPSMATLVYAARQRALGVALATQAILLCARRTLSPNDSVLDLEAMNLCDRILIITDEARINRPHGAVWTVHTLICTWCAVRDISLRAKIENALLDYQRDAMGPNFQLQLDQLKLLERRLSLHERF